MEITITMGGAKITVPTDELFKAWLEKHVNRPDAGLLVPELKDGELWAGIIVRDSKPHHHVILLPGEIEDSHWQNSMDWASSIGGMLPDRCEQALLFANLKDQFKEEWYWSGAQDASDSDSAWRQFSGSGGQYICDKDCRLRARAVCSILVI